MIKYRLSTINSFLKEELDIKTIEQRLAKHAVEINYHDTDYIDLSLPHNRVDLISYYGIARSLQDDYQAGKCILPSLHNLELLIEGTIYVVHCDQTHFTKPESLLLGLTSIIDDTDLTITTPWDQWLKCTQMLYGVRVAVVNKLDTISSVLSSQKNFGHQAHGKRFYLCFYGSYLHKCEVDPKAFKNLVSYTRKSLRNTGITTLVEYANVHLTQHSNLPLAIDRIKSSISPHLTTATIYDTLTKRGYHIQSSGLYVDGPVFRHDINHIQDMVEDIVQQIDIQCLEAEPAIDDTIHGAALRPHHDHEAYVKDLMVRLGFNETKIIPFTDKKGAYMLSDPMDVDRPYMRSDITDLLYDQVIHNLKFKGNDTTLAATKLFEIGTVFTVAGEELYLGFAIHSHKDTDSLRSALGVAEHMLHPETTKVIKEDGITFKLDDHEVGTIKMNSDVALCDLSLASLRSKDYMSDTISIPSNFVNISRDISVQISLTSSYQQIDQCLADVQYQLIDIFTTQEFITYTIRVFYPTEHNVTKDLLNQYVQSITDSLIEKGCVVK